MTLWNILWNHFHAQQFDFLISLFCVLVPMHALLAHFLRGDSWLYSWEGCLFAFIKSSFCFTNVQQVTITARYTINNSLAVIGVDRIRSTVQHPTNCPCGFHKRVHFVTSQAGADTGGMQGMRSHTRPKEVLAWHRFHWKS